MGQNTTDDDAREVTQYRRIAKSRPLGAVVCSKCDEKEKQRIEGDV